MAVISSGGRIDWSEPFYQISCGERTSALPVNRANCPSSNDIESCPSSKRRAGERRKRHSGSSHREPINAQNLSSDHSTRNPNESGSRIVSLSRTLSRLGQSMRRRSTASAQQMFPTNFASLLDDDAPWLKSLDKHFESQQSPAKLKVILKVSEFSCSVSSLMKINESRKLTSLQDPSGASSHGRIYAFDHIYVPGDPVSEINVNSLGGILKAVLGGCDGCVFTYGLAKTGKTYTMLGVDNSVDNLGVIPFAIAWLFHLIRRKEETTDAEISVFMSAVEVFDSGEVLRDLMSHVGNSSDVVGQAVGVNDEPLDGTHLRNQRGVKICSPQEAGLYLDAVIASQTTPGRNRVAQNVHVIFSFRLRQKQTNGQGSSGQGFSSWLRLIDFSSARRDKSGSAVTFSGLTSIIQAALSGRRDLPFRDRNITKIILESLGGASCHVCMITHVSLTRNSFHDLQQVIHVSSQLQDQHATKTSKTFCICSPCGLNAPLPDTPQRRPRAIQMGTKLYHHALQKSAIYSDPEGILPERLPSYYNRFRSGAVSSGEIDVATKSSHVTRKASKRVLPANTSSRSVESVRYLSDAGFQRCNSRAIYMAFPLTYQQPTVQPTVPSSLAYHVMAQTTAVPSSVSYQHSTTMNSKSANLAHQMAGPATDCSSLHCSKGRTSKGVTLVETCTGHHADEVWVDGPPEFRMNCRAEFNQQVQLGSPSEYADAKSARKQHGFPVAELSSSPRRSVDRKQGSAVSDSFTLQESCGLLSRSAKDFKRTLPSAIPKERADFGCKDWDCNAGRKCRIVEEKDKTLTVVHETNLDVSCSFKESSDVTNSVSQLSNTESTEAPPTRVNDSNIESSKAPPTRVKESDLISRVHSHVYDVDMVSVLKSENPAKEVMRSRQMQVLISDSESVYEVMFEETLEDGDLCETLNSNTENLSEDNSFKNNPAVVESKIADCSKRDVTCIDKQSPSRKMEQALDYTAGSTETQGRHGWRPDNVIISSRKSFPFLGSQAIRAEVSFCKPQVGPFVAANNGMTCEARIQSPYCAVTQARPSVSTSSGLGSEVSSTVSSDVQRPANWRKEVEYSSGYETVVQETSQQLSGKKHSTSRDVLMQNSKLCEYVTVRSRVRSRSNTGFIPSPSAQNNSSAMNNSPEVLSSRTPAGMKGSTDSGVAQTLQSVEPNVPQRKVLQILGIHSYQRALEFRSMPTSANTGKETLSHPAIDHSYICAVDEALSFQAKDFKDPKRRNSSKSRMSKINCFNK